jgi:hypothetical protein
MTQYVTVEEGGVHSITIHEFGGGGEWEGG